MNDQLQSIDQVTATAIDLAVRFGPKVVVAILIMVAGYFAGAWAARALGRMLDRFLLEPPVQLLLERLARLLVLGVFAIMALQNLGVELLPLIAGLGLAGAGIALAMQGVLSNIAAGLTIIFTRPFRVGDYISIVKEEGQVLDVRLFNTTLGHADLSEVVIPNRKIVGEILHNYGKIRQLWIEVPVAYACDLDAVLAAVGDVLRGNARVLKDPAPISGVARLTDSCVIIGAGPWVQVGDYGAARAELQYALLEAFRARRIPMPPPQRDVSVLGAGGLRGVA